MTVSFSRPQPHTSGWKGKTSYVSVRLDGKLVGEIVGRENAGIAGWMEWTVELLGKPSTRAESLVDAKAKARTLLEQP